MCAIFCCRGDVWVCDVGLYGVCGKKHRSHVFRVDAEQIGEAVRKTFHKNSKGKQFSVNYKVAVALQQMGCGTTDVATLAGFVDLPSSGSAIEKQIKQVERVIGEIQIVKREESKVEALPDEVIVHENEDDL